MPKNLFKGKARKGREVMPSKASMGQSGGASAPKGGEKPMIYEGTDAPPAKAGPFKRIEGRVTKLAADAYMPSPASMGHGKGRKGKVANMR